VNELRLLAPPIPPSKAPKFTLEYHIRFARPNFPMRHGLGSATQVLIGASADVTDINSGERRRTKLGLSRLSQP
jgi:hypothetical protein